MDLESSGRRCDRRGSGSLASGDGCAVSFEDGSDRDGMDRQKTGRGILII